MADIDEQYEMKHRDPEEPQDNDYDRWETSLNNLDDATVGEAPEQLTTVDEFDDDESIEIISESREPEELREIFNEVFGAPIRVDDNRELFENCIIRTERSDNNRIHTRLFYKNEAVYYKRGVKGKWRLYSKFRFNNSMYREFEKAKKSYDESATKQVNDNAGVLVTEETSEEVIGEVIDELSAQTDEFETSELSLPQTPPERSSDLSSSQVINVSELETKVTSLEDANKKLWKILQTAEHKLNKLRLEHANGDVINAQQQEINNIQAKLKETKLERDQLLLDVVVTNELLSEASNKVDELIERNKSIDEEYKQFRDAATKKMKAERQEVADRYREQVKYDKEQARQEYTESMVEIKTEYIKELSLVKDKNARARNELDSAKERIKFLEEAILKQHGKEPEQSSDGVERVSRGVQQTIDKISNAIDDNEYDELYINTNIEHLRAQAKDFEQKAKKSTGLLKKLNERAQKYIEKKIDEINLRLDRKVEYPETKQRLKRATDNNPKVKFERVKKWLKDNGLEASTLVISIGGLIAALATALRNTARTIAKGTFSFGKAVVKVLSKLGPVFSALGNILMSALGLVSKALLWLGNNLWVLLILFIMFLWDFSSKMYNKYKK